MQDAEGGREERENPSSLFLGENAMGYGTTVERGKIVRQEEDGRWIVESIDRDGVDTLPMRAMESVKEGDMVVFCEFADGEGVIFGRV